jgi:hypothetical protein
MKEVFKEGETIFFANGLEKKIESRIVHRVELLIDNSPRYWLKGYFGYFYPGCLFKTEKEAKDYIKNLESEDDRNRRRVNPKISRSKVVL